MQRQNAKRRGVPFNLTFEQWWALWNDSGKWTRRGRCLGQYCMARKGDRGPYAIGNVFIVTVSRNGSEIEPYVRDEAWRQRLGQQMKGNKINVGRGWTEQQRKRFSKATKGRVPGFGGKKHSAATIKLMKARWKNQTSAGVAHHG